MNADSDFQIGKDHLVCQDYAIAAARDYEAYAIVCDGCSASPDVDIGARLLALAAKETRLAEPDRILENDGAWNTFGMGAIERLKGVFTMFPHLHPQSLDATLLMSSVFGTESRTFIYGDGFFFHKSSEGVFSVKVELTSGAPDYLSYYLNPDRKNEYDKYSLDEKEVKEITTDNGEKRTVDSVLPFSPVVISRTVSPGDIIVICSDGISSFSDAENNPISWTDLVDEFVGFKSFAGVFAKRRMAALRRKCQQKGWKHSDDISIAAIVI